MDVSLKFLWAYMIERGRLTTGEWSYYGGSFVGTTGDWDRDEKLDRDFRSMVKSVGIDWDKTGIPESSMESAFTDTFHDADRVETLLGVIVLKDGSVYTVGVSNSDVRFGQYIRSVKAFNEDKQRVRDILGEDI